MTASLEVPRLDHEISRLKERVSDLERVLRRRVIPTGPIPQDILSFPGALFAQYGPVFEPTVRRSYYELLITQRVAATSSFTFRLTRSDVTFDTYTVPANTARVSFSIDFVLTPGQDLNGQIVTTGTGGEDLLAHLRY